MTFDESRLTVLQMTAPQPSSKALPQTLALVPGGPEPMTKGLGSLMPLTVVARVGILVGLLICPRMDANGHETRRGRDAPATGSGRRIARSRAREHEQVVEDEGEGEGE